MKSENKDPSSAIGVHAANHIKEKLDPNGELPVLTDEQIEIVADRIYQRLKEKRKTKQPFHDEQTESPKSP